jgi:geranyl-CoA carboxylase beta subunit
VPGGGVIAGIGLVAGVCCMVSANDSGIDAGALQPYGLDKTLRVQELALRTSRLTCSWSKAPARIVALPRRGFVRGGNIFAIWREAAAAGLLVVTVTMAHRPRAVPI